MYILLKVFSMCLVEEILFLPVVKIPYLKNLSLVTLKSFISTCKVFPGRGGYFLLVNGEKVFNEKVSSLTRVEK